MGKPLPGADRIDSNVQVLDAYAFVETDDGQVARRVKLSGAAVFTPSGLFNGGLVTEVALSDASWVALPTVALTDRNAIAVQNTTDFEMKLNYVDSVGYVGVIIPANAERFYNITDAIVIYGRLETGGIGSVVVEELS